MNNAQVHPLFAGILNSHEKAANMAVEQTALKPFLVSIITGQCSHSYIGLYRHAIDASMDGRRRAGMEGKVIVRPYEGRAA